MGKIEVGEYLRNNHGYIGKIKRIEFDKIDISLKWYVFDYKEPNSNIVKEIYINKPYIVKHSFKLIDLIEVGDAIKIKENLHDNFVKFIENEEMLLALKIYAKKFEIVEILTHEQYEQNCFKADENKILDKIIRNNLVATQNNFFDYYK